MTQHTDQEQEKRFRTVKGFGTIDTQIHPKVLAAQQAFAQGRGKRQSPLNSAGFHNMRLNKEEGS